MTHVIPAARSASARPLRVLVTGAGGAAAVSVLRALDDGTVQLFAGDMDPHAAGLYLVPTERRALLMRGDDPAFVSRLLDLCRSWSIDVLIPTVDVELLPVAEAEARFREVGTDVVVASAPALRRTLDKLALARACEGAVAVPQTAALDESFDPEAWTWPVIVKPRRGSGGRGFRIVHDASELEGCPRDGSLLVQEYLPGEEYSVDVFADLEGRVRAAVPRVRLKVDSGVAVAARTVHDAELEEAAAAVVGHLGLTFVSNVQFRRDRQGRPKLLEINPRFPGTMPLTIAAGVNMPRMAMLAVRGFRAWPDRADFEEITVVRHWQEVFLPADAFQALGSESHESTGIPAVPSEEAA